MANSGLAYSSTASDRADLNNIEVLQDWAIKMSNQSQIPSVISYTRSTDGAAQWGSDFGDNAVTMSRTKLELQPQESLEELDMLMQVLKGTGFLAFNPTRDGETESNYAPKNPEEIITDYLTKIFECASVELKLEELVRTQTPVDIVLTVPVVLISSSGSILLDVC